MEPFILLICSMNSYYVYFITNKHRKVLYAGVTNDLQRRLSEHHEDSKGPKKSFAGKFNCSYLVHYEEYNLIDEAIRREKEIKGWRRSKKVALIANHNPEWRFLNDELGIVLPE